MLGGLDDTYAPEVRRTIAPLTAAKIGANSAARFAAPFIATIASGLHVSLTTLGTAIAVGELTGLSAPLLTRIVAPLTRRTAICGGLLGVAVAASVCATSHSPVQFAIGLVLLTMTKIVFDLGIFSWITDRVAYAQRGRVFGLTETAWAGGLLIGVVSMGLLTGATSWRWGYALAVVAIVLLAALLRAVLPDEVAPPRVDRQHAAVGARMGSGWWVILGTLTLTAAAQSVFVTFGKWLQSQFGFSDAKLTGVVFGLGAIELLATSVSVRFLDRWGKQQSTMVGAAVVVPCGLLLALLHDHVVPGVIVLALFIGVFEFTIVCSLSLSSGLVPDRPSRGLGLNVGGTTLGRALMAPIATAAYTAHGMWLPAVIGAGAASLSVGCQWRYRVSRGSRW